MHKHNQRGVQQYTPETEMHAKYMSIIDLPFVTFLPIVKFFPFLLEEIPSNIHSNCYLQPHGSENNLVVLDIYVSITVWQ